MDRATQRKLLRSAIIEVLEDYLNTQGFTVAQEKRIREIVAEELSKRPTTRETINDLMERLESLDKVSLAESTTHGSNEAAQDKE